MILDMPGAHCVNQEIESRCRHCRAGSYALCENGSLGQGSRGVGGGWGDGFTAYETEVYRVPDALGDEAAVMIEPLAVSVRTALRRLPQGEERALVVGSGTIGLGVVQAVRALSPGCHITAMARYPQHSHCQGQAERCHQGGAGLSLRSGGTVMESAVYFRSALLLVVATFVVFRLFVRRDYQRKGRLSPFSGFLELLIWGLYMGFPYIYNPPEWAWFWSSDAPVGMPLRIAGVACILTGLALAFITMFWFGLRRAFRLEVSGLIQSGPYRVSRNPQIVGGSLLVVGSVLLWPSWYALGWALLYGVVAHTMVLTEEEHLRDVYGDAYVVYCERVPRYLGFSRGLWNG